VALVGDGAGNYIGGDLARADESKLGD